MSTNTKWVLVFAFIMLIIGLNQYFGQQKDNSFQSTLISFHPQDIDRIHIKTSPKDSFQLLKNNDRWLLSAQNVHESIQADKVMALLKYLKNIRTQKIISQQTNNWSDYQLAENQGVQVCLQSQQEKATCIRFGNTQFTTEDKKLEAYVRLANQDKVYSINGFSKSQLNTDFNYYRNNVVTAIKQSISRMRIQTDSSSFEAQKWQQQWVDEDKKLLDSTLWTDLSKQISHINATHFADDVDELKIAEEQYAQLNIYTYTDSVQLNIYHNKDKALAFTIQSQQHPKCWMACDSSDLYKLIPIPIWAHLE